MYNSVIGLLRNISMVEYVKVYCEVFTKIFLPAIRALIAEKLIEKYNLTQIEVAKKMGLTQAAISHYLRSKRGAKAYNILKANDDIDKHIEKIADALYREENNFEVIYQGVCFICGWLREHEDVVKEIISDEKEILYPPLK